MTDMQNGEDSGQTAGSIFQMMLFLMMLGDGHKTPPEGPRAGIRDSGANAGMPPSRGFGEARLSPRNGDLPSMGSGAPTGMQGMQQPRSQGPRTAEQRAANDDAPASLGSHVDEARLYETSSSATEAGIVHGGVLEIYLSPSHKDIRYFKQPVRRKQNNIWEGRVRGPYVSSELQGGHSLANRAGEGRAYPHSMPRIAAGDQLERDVVEGVVDGVFEFRF